MTVTHFAPYVMTLRPGPNAEQAAERAARYIIDTWMPGNAGGVHLMVTPRLTKALLAIYTAAKGPVRVRVSLDGNVPLLEVLS